MKDLEREDSKGGSDRRSHVVLAVTVMLSLCILLAGFLAGFYMLKEAVLDSQERLETLVEEIQNDAVLPEDFEYSKQDELPTSNDENDKDKPKEKSTLHKDEDKGLWLLVNEDTKECFVAPEDKDNISDPEVERLYDEQIPDIEIPESNETKMVMVAHDLPIVDTEGLGEQVARLCEGMKVYWLYPHYDRIKVPQEEAEEGASGEMEDSVSSEEVKSRQKRSGRGHRRRFRRRKGRGHHHHHHHHHHHKGGFKLFRPYIRPVIYHKPVIYYPVPIIVAAPTCYSTFYQVVGCQHSCCQQSCGGCGGYGGYGGCFAASSGGCYYHGCQTYGRAC